MIDTGIQDIFKNLDSLAPKVEQKLFRKGLKEIGDELIQEVKSLVPVQTGELRDSINKKVSLDKKYFGGLNLRIGSGAFYARFIEMGFMHKGNVHIPARPFLTPVLESAFSRVMSKMKTFLQSEIPKEMAKSAKSFVKGK